MRLRTCCVYVCVLNSLAFSNKLYSELRQHKYSSSITCTAASGKESLNCLFCEAARECNRLFAFILSRRDNTLEFSSCKPRCRLSVLLWDMTRHDYLPYIPESMTSTIAEIRVTVLEKHSHSVDFIFILRWSKCKPQFYIQYTFRALDLLWKPSKISFVENKLYLYCLTWLQSNRQRYKCNSTILECHHL